MATWAIGDVHGCFRTLRALLGRMDLDVRTDRLWMVGDLVNRGPRSLKALRWARAMDAEMGERFQIVLGNHDLHLIARHLGVAGARPRDTLKKALKAKDAPELIDWLRRRPLVHFERTAGRDYVLVHAGLRPGWSDGDALEAARRLERKLRGQKAKRLLRRRNEPSLTAFTRMRMLDAKSRPSTWNGPPEEAPDGLRPWFDVEPRGCPDRAAVCGHWAALGLRSRHDLLALDTGCVWGGELTAVRLDDRLVVRAPFAG
ncbi:MAG: symmetrical bis(5'-nucleosyl)-tetraphosphatase [Acidobacteriota bacterium]|nr:symmetrical bis(5'-nucleosyl)-tetraphosphatase [Acidobacteriota bacterium]